MKIWKTSTIRLTEVNGDIVSEIPLKIWAKVRYGTSFMGLNDTKEINLITMLAKNLNYFQKILFHPNIKEISYYKNIPFLVLH